MSHEKVIEDIKKIGLPPKAEEAYICLLEVVQECKKILNRSKVEFVERDEVVAAKEILLGTRDLLLLIQEHLDGKITNEELIEKAEEICDRVDNGEDNWWKGN